jgi:hypothetical protein
MKEEMSRRKLTDSDIHARVIKTPWSGRPSFRNIRYWYGVVGQGRGSIINEAPLANSDSH